MNKTNYDLLQQWMNGDIKLSSNQVSDLLEGKDVYTEINETKTEFELSEEMIDKAIKEYFDNNPEEYDNDEDDEIADEEYENGTDSGEQPYVNIHYCFDINGYNNADFSNQNHTSLDDVYRMMQQDQDETDAEDAKKQDDYINGRIEYIKNMHKNQAEQEKRHLIENKLNQIKNLVKEITVELNS